MRKINFLSKSSSQSCGHSSVTLGSTVGSPLVHRRGTMLRLLSVLVLVLTIGVGNVWGALTEEYSYTFTAQQFSNNSTAKTLGTITWTPSTSWKSGSGYWGYDGTKGQQWGSGKNGLNTLTLTAGSSISNIKKITINASIASDGSCKLSVKVGNTTIGTEKTLTTTATSYDFESATSLTGAVQIKLYNNSVNKAQYIKSITIYTEEAPAYTITASSNNNSWGTVSVSGTTITATPADCYQVASGTSGYNKVSGTGTINHTGNSNTISVTPTSNCSIQVIFEKKIVNTYIDEIQDNGEFEDCSTSAPSLTDKSAATTGTCAQQHYHFVGWVTAANKANPTNENIIEAGDDIAVNGTTYYAVWAKGSAGSSATVTFSSVNSDSNTENTNISNQVSSASGISSYSSSRAYNGTYGLKLGTGSYSGNVGCTLSSSVNTKTITIDAKKYGSDTGTLSVTVNGSTTFGSAQSPSTNGGLLTFTNNTSVAVESVVIATSTKRAYIKTITIGEATTYTDYITQCCQELGSINGSVSWNQGKAEIHCANLADVSSWGVEYKLHSAENYTVYSGSANWETYDDQSTNDMRKILLDDLNLAAGSQYDFKVTGTYGGSTYCSGDFEAALSPNSSSYVPQMGDPSVSSITGLGYIVEAASSAAQSFTISASHLTGNLTVTAPNANFEVSTTSGTTGFGSSATLTPTSGSLTNAEVWVRLATGLAENTYGGNSTYVTITGGGAAGKQVAVTGIVGASCHTPSISGSLSDATYNLNAEANALMITATKGDNSDPDLTYQWLQCATSNGTYTNAVGGTGATTNSYIPPTTTAGSDLYYKCKVNSGTCFDYSGVARIQVNTPVIKLNDATNNIDLDFEDRAVDATTGYTMSFTVSGQYLGEDISIAKSGTNEAMFTLSASSVNKETDGTAASTAITVTYKPSTAGSHSATLTLSSDQAISRTVTLSGTGKWKAAFMNGTNLEEHSSVLVANNAAPSKPSNPAACDANSTTFIGWTQTAWSGKKAQSYIDGLSGADKIVYTGDLPAMTDHVTYYPVYASGEMYWGRLTSSNLSGLADGDRIVIVSTVSGNSGALQSTDSGDGIGIASVPAENANNRISNPSNDIIWTLSASGNVWEIMSGTAKLGSKYTNCPKNDGTGIVVEKGTNWTTWEIGSSSSGTDMIYIENASPASCNLGLGITSDAWRAIKQSDVTSNAGCALKVYKEIGNYSDYLTTCITCDDDPTVGAASNSDVTASNATVSCTDGITKGSCNIEEYGFFYKTGTSGVTKDDTKVKVSDDNNAPFTTNIGSFDKAFAAGALTPGTHYYFRAYALVNGEYILGDETDFTTKSITVTSNNNTYGTVSGSGLSWTGAPATGYTYAETAYTLSSGNNTTVDIAGNDITITSTSTADVAIVINFAAKPTYTITLDAGNGSVTADGWIASEGVWTKTQTNGDAAITFPEASCNCAGWVFQGWKLGTVVNDEDSFTADKNAGDELVPAGNVTYYAVYRQNATGGTTYNKITSTGDLTTGNYMIIADGSYNDYAMKNDVSGDHMDEETVSAGGASITGGNAALTWTIIKFGSQVVIKNGTNYLGIDENNDICLTTTPYFYTYAYNTTSNSWEFSSVSKASYQIVYNGYFRAKTEQDYIIMLFKQGACLTGNYFTNPSCSDLTVTGVAAPVAGGTVMVSAASAKAGDKVYAYYEVDNAYKFNNWSVSEGSSLSSTSTQLTEVTIGGSTDVTITANFTAKAVATVKFYNNGVQVGPDQEVVEGNAPVAPTLTDGHVDSGGNACDANSTQHYGWTKTTWMNTLTKTQVDGKTGADVVYNKSADLPEITAGDNDEIIEYHAVWRQDNSTPTTSYAAITSGLESDNYVIAYKYRSNGTQFVLKNEAEDGTSTTELEGYELSMSSSKYAKPGNAYIWALQKQADGSYYIYNATIEKYVNATTSALTLSETPTKFVLTYDGPNSRWTAQIKDNDEYYMHGYSNNSDYFFKVSDAPGTSNNPQNYILLLYKNEKEASYSNYRTTCCEKRGITLSGVVDGEKEFIADLDEACEGETVTLAYSEDGHYNFSSWNVTYVDGESVEHSVGVNGENKFVMPAYAVTVEAYWSPKNYMVTIASAANGSATVVEGYAQQDGKWLVPYGSTVTLQATPVDGEHYFAGWTLSPDMDVDKTQATLAISMQGSFTATPSFAAVEYPELTLGTSDNYTLSATLLNGDPVNMESIRSGTDIKVTYSLIGQYEFDSWNFSQSITKNATDNYVTFKMPSTDLTVDLNAVAYYLLNLSVENGSVTVNGADQDEASAQYRFHNGDDVEIAATPTNETYKFKEWTSDGFTEDNALTTDATGALFEMKTNNLTLHVAFEPKEHYTLTLNALGRTHATFADRLEGTSIGSLIEDVVAPRLEGYEFLGWSLDENDKDMIVNGSNDMDLDDNYAMYAVYQKMKYKYALVESDLGTNWAGDYLIAYSSSIFADGRVGGTSGMGAQHASVNPETNLSGKVVAASWGDTYHVTLEEISANSNTYVLKTQDGKYNYRSSNSNGLDATNNKSTAANYPIIVTYNSSSDIELGISNGVIFHYNPDGYFRFYKSGGQENVYLYKKVGELDETVPAVSVPTLTVENTEVINTDGLYPDGVAGNIVVEAGGKLTGSNALEVNNLTINSESGASGQVSGTNVQVNGDLVLEIKLDKSGTMDPHKYYCISAPFDVAALEWGNGTPMEFNVDYQLFKYDGDKRARTGNGWQRVGATMEKNSAYFIGFDDENENNQNIIRLKAANKAIPTATSIELEEHSATYGQNESEIAKNSNWNGLGNPRLNYVNLNKNVSVYEAEEERFDTYAKELANGFVVGTAFFVQGTGDLTFDNAAHGAYRAPKRESEHYMYCVEIAQENASRYDNRLYVMASETASSSFEEGKDLPTLNSETSKYGALIWTKNYGMRLVIEETPMVNNKASYELGIFAPTAGTYSISVAAPQENAELYLTKNGHIIWNLTMSPCELELTQGQNEGYGLILRANAPSTATGVDEVQSDNVQCTKVVIDDHVYILRGGKMYGVDGKEVR